MPKTIYVDNLPVVKDKKYTFLAAGANATDTTISVSSNVGFNSLTTSSGQILIIGEVGSEKSEVIKTSATTAPSGQTITLASQLRFDHSADKRAYVVDFDRFGVQWASTVTGTKQTLAAYSPTIQADQKESLYYDSVQSSGFYFARFENSIEGTSSDWSDAIPYSGFADNTVIKIKERALGSVGAEIDEKITHSFLNQKLWEARREVHNAPGKRPFRRKFDQDVGNATAGIYRFALPSNVQKPHTADNVYGVRIGREEELDYIDKKEWNSYYVNSAHSTLQAAYVHGTAQDLYLADVRDLPNSGDVQILDTTIGYSARGISGGTLRISSHGEWDASAGDDVWYNATHGLPTKFTVFGDVGGSAYVYFNCPLATAYTSQNIWMDYYQTLQQYDSDADELDEPEYDMYVNWLSWCIKKRKDLSLKAEEDDDFREWQRKYREAVGKEILSTDINLVPGIDHLTIPS